MARSPFFPDDDELTLPSTEQAPTGQEPEPPRKKRPQGPQQPASDPYADFDAAMGKLESGKVTPPGQDDSYAQFEHLMGSLEKGGTVLFAPGDEVDPRKPPKKVPEEPLSPNPVIRTVQKIRKWADSVDEQAAAERANLPIDKVAKALEAFASTGPDNQIAGAALPHPMPAGAVAGPPTGGGDAVSRGVAAAGATLTRAVESPDQAVEQLARMPWDSGNVLFRYVVQKEAEREGLGAQTFVKDLGWTPVSGKEAAWAAAQLGSLAIAGPVENMVAARLKSEILGAAISGGTIGAAYSPDNPAVGGVAGGILGGIFAGARRAVAEPAAGPGAAPFTPSDEAGVPLGPTGPTGPTGGGAPPVEPAPPPTPVAPTAPATPIIDEILKRGEPVPAGGVPEEFPRPMGATPVNVSPELPPFQPTNLRSFRENLRSMSPSQLDRMGQDLQETVRAILEHLQRETEPARKALLTQYANDASLRLQEVATERTGRAKGGDVGSLEIPAKRGQRPSARRPQAAPEPAEGETYVPRYMTPIERLAAHEQAMNAREAVQNLLAQKDPKVEGVPPGRVREFLEKSLADLDRHLAELADERKPILANPDERARFETEIQYKRQTEAARAQEAQANKAPEVTAASPPATVDRAIDYWKKRQEIAESVAKMTPMGGVERIRAEEAAQRARSTVEALEQQKAKGPEARPTMPERPAEPSGVDAYQRGREIHDQSLKQPPGTAGAEQPPATIELEPAAEKPKSDTPLLDLILKNQMEAEARGETRPSQTSILDDAIARTIWEQSTHERRAKLLGQKSENQFEPVEGRDFEQLTREEQQRVMQSSDAKGLRAIAMQNLSREIATKEQRDEAARVEAEKTKAAAAPAAAPPEPPKFSAREPVATAPQKAGPPERGQPPAMGGSVRMEKLANVDVEPDKLQYKIDTDEKGLTSELKSIQKWNPDLAGVMTVARNPEDGRLKVINGHQRHGLASRLGVDEIAIREVPWTGWKGGRALGALINIAEGRGTAIDAAKFLRESGIEADDLALHGINIGGSIARDGMALSKLAPSVFARVVRGTLGIERGAVIGKGGLTDAQQIALIGLLDKQAKRGTKLSNDALAELIRFVKGAGEHTEVETSLFGEEQITRSLAAEKAELSAYVKDRLAKDRRLFGFLTKGGRAERIEGAGAGKIETGKAGDIARAAAQTEELYNKLSTSAGPVADALTTAARELAAGGNGNDIRQGLYEAVARAVRQAAGFREAPSAGESAGSAGGREQLGDAGGRPTAEGPAEEEGPGLGLESPKKKFTGGAQPSLFDQLREAVNAPKPMTPAERAETENAPGTLGLPKFKEPEERPHSFAVESVQPGEKGTARYRTDPVMKKYLLAKRPRPDATQEIITYRTETAVGWHQALDDDNEAAMEFLSAEHEWAMDRLRELAPDVVESLERASAEADKEPAKPTAEADEDLEPEYDAERYDDLLEQLVALDEQIDAWETAIYGKPVGHLEDFPEPIIEGTDHENAVNAWNELTRERLAVLTTIEREFGEDNANDAETYATEAFFNRHPELQQREKKTPKKKATTQESLFGEEPASDEETIDEGDDFQDDEEEYEPYQPGRRMEEPQESMFGEDASIGAEIPSTMSREELERIIVVDGLAQDENEIKRYGGRIEEAFQSRGKPTVTEPGAVARLDREWQQHNRRRLNALNALEDRFGEEAMDRATLRLTNAIVAGMTSAEAEKGPLPSDQVQSPPLHLPPDDATAAQLSEWIEEHVEGGLPHVRGDVVGAEIDREYERRKLAMWRHPFWQRYLRMGAERLIELSRQRHKLSQEQSSRANAQAKAKHPNEPMLHYAENWPLWRHRPPFMREAWDVGQELANIEHYKRSKGDWVKKSLAMAQERYTKALAKFNTLYEAAEQGDFRPERDDFLSANVPPFGPPRAEDAPSPDEFYRRARRRVKGGGAQFAPPHPKLNALLAEILDKLQDAPPDTKQFFEVLLGGPAKTTSKRIGRELGVRTQAVFLSRFNRLGLPSLSDYTNLALMLRLAEYADDQSKSWRQVSNELDLASPQSTSRFIRRYTGMTPGRWRRVQGFDRLRAQFLRDYIDPFVDTLRFVRLVEGPRQAERMYGEGRILFSKKPVTGMVDGMLQEIEDALAKAGADPRIAEIFRHAATGAPSSASVARAFGVNQVSLTSAFYRAGAPPAKDIINAVRVVRAAEVLSDPDISVAKAAQIVGYRDEHASPLVNLLKRAVGMTAEQLRRDTTPQAVKRQFMEQFIRPNLEKFADVTFPKSRQEPEQLEGLEANAPPFDVDARLADLKKRIDAGEAVPEEQRREVIDLAEMRYEDWWNTQPRRARVQMVTERGYGPGFADKIRDDFSATHATRWIAQHYYHEYRMFVRGLPNGGRLAEPTPFFSLHKTPGNERFFYSRLRRAIEGAPFEKGTPAQWKAQVSKTAEAEREWVSIEDALNEAGPGLTKTALLHYVDRAAIALTERVDKGSEDVEGIGEAQRKFDIATRQLRQELVRSFQSFTRTEIDDLLDRVTRRLYSGGSMLSTPESKVEATLLALYSYSEPDKDDREPLRIALTHALEAHDVWTRAHEFAMGRLAGDAQYQKLTEPGGTNYREIKIMLDRTSPGAKWRGFQAGHFPQANIVVHVRAKDRVVDGEKVLFLEEVQSDWAQRGRERGFTPQRAKPLEWSETKPPQNIDALIYHRGWYATTPHGIVTIVQASTREATRPRYFLQVSRGKLESVLNGNDVDAITELMGLGDRQRPLTSSAWYDSLAEAKSVAESMVERLGVPDFPFRRTQHWVELALKRMIEEAVDGGYDRIAWTTGLQQDYRYDIAQVADDLRYDPRTHRLEAWKDRSYAPELVHEGKYTPEQLPGVIGKDVTRRLLATEPTRSSGEHVLSGRNLSVSDPGMTAFYERILPGAARDIGRELGAPITVDRIPATKIRPPVPDSFGRDDPDFDIVDALTERELGLQDAANPSFKITPAIVDAVRAKGFALLQNTTEFQQGPMPRRTRGFARDLDFVAASRYNTAEYRGHKDFAASKRGDVMAGVRFVFDHLPRTAIDEAKRTFGADVIYIAPTAMEEGTEVNVVPQLVAERLAMTTAAGVPDRKVVQSVRTGHSKAKNTMERLVAPAEFTGPIERGARYVIVDDVVTSGGTVAALANYIQRQGGIIAGVFALADASRSRTLAADPSLTQALEERFGDTIREEFGIEPATLTQDEADAIAGHGTADGLRAAAAAAREAVDGRAGRQGAARRVRRARPTTDLAPDAFRAFGPLEQGTNEFEEWKAQIHKDLTESIDRLKALTRRIEEAQQDGRFRPDAAPAEAIAARLASWETTIPKYEAKPLPGVVYTPKHRTIDVDLATAFLQKFEATRLLGKKVDTQADLVLAAQLLRNPFFETARLFFVKGNEIVAETAVSSRLAGSTQMFLPGAKPMELADYVLDRMEQSGADGVWLMHNHPSGDVTASKADKQATTQLHLVLKKRAEQRGVKATFHGHVIINHLRYTSLTVNEQDDGLHMTEQEHEFTPLVKAYPDILREQDENPFPALNRKLTDTDSVAEVTALIQPADRNGTILWVDGVGRVGEVGTIDIEWLRHHVQQGTTAQVSAALADHANSVVGAVHVNLILDLTHANVKLAYELMKLGIVMMVAFHNGTGNEAFKNTILDGDEIVLAPYGWVNEAAATYKLHFGQSRKMEEVERTNLMRVSSPIRHFSSGAEGEDDSLFGDLNAQEGAHADHDDQNAHEQGHAKDEREEDRGAQRPAREARDQEGHEEGDQGPQSVVGERDLFGNPIGETEREPAQSSLFGASEGTAKSRPLTSAERAARASLEKLYQLEKGLPAGPKRDKVTRQIVELEKFVNRDRAISASELQRRVRAEKAGDEGLFGAAEASPEHPQFAVWDDSGPTGRNEYARFDTEAEADEYRRTMRPGAEVSRVTKADDEHEQAEFRTDEGTGTPKTGTPRSRDELINALPPAKQAKARDLQNGIDAIDEALSTRKLRTTGDGAHAISNSPWIPVSLLKDSKREYRSHGGAWYEIGAGDMERLQERRKTLERQVMKLLRGEGLAANIGEFSEGQRDRDQKNARWWSGYIPEERDAIVRNWIETLYGYSHEMTVGGLRPQQRVRQGFARFEYDELPEFMRQLVSIERETTEVQPHWDPSAPPPHAGDVGETMARRTKALLAKRRAQLDAWKARDARRRQVEPEIRDETVLDEAARASMRALDVKEEEHQNARSFWNSLTARDRRAHLVFWAAQDSQIAELEPEELRQISEAHYFDLPTYVQKRVINLYRALLEHFPEPTAETAAVSAWWNGLTREARLGYFSTWTASDPDRNVRWLESRQQLAERKYHRLNDEQQALVADAYFIAHPKGADAYTGPRMKYWDRMETAEEWWRRATPAARDYVLKRAYIDQLITLDDWSNHVPVEGKSADWSNLSKKVRDAIIKTLVAGRERDDDMPHDPPPLPEDDEPPPNPWETDGDDFLLSSPKKDFSGTHYTGPHPAPPPTGLSQHEKFNPQRIARAILTVFAPTELGAGGKDTAGSIRHEFAIKHQDTAQAEEALADLKGVVDRMPRARQIALWDAADRGVPFGDPLIDTMIQTFRRVTAQRTRELIRLNRLGAEKALRNYVGRYWEMNSDPKKLTDFLKSIFARRPVEGPKSFLMQRSLEYFVEGLDAGLQPPTYNFVESQLAKIGEMDRLIAVEHVKRFEAQQGRAIPLIEGMPTPFDAEGRPWVPIDREGNDPAFTIWGDFAVQHWEGVDAIVYGKLMALLESLGIPHKRILGMPPGVMGYAQGTKATGSTEIATKFGGPMGVIMHEMGHVLDSRYGLRRLIEHGIGSAPKRRIQKGKRAGKEVPDYSKKGGDTPQARARRQQLRDELRALANLRRERMVPGTMNTHVPTDDELSKSQKAYLHSWPEKMANMVEAFIANRDTFRRVAPGVFSIFEGIVEANPELHPLKSIEPSLSREPHSIIQELPGRMRIGRWFAPNASAAVWHNHLSSGIRGSKYGPIFRMLQRPGMAAQQILLGFSGFHMTVIATEGMFSDLVLALDHLRQKQFGAAARSVGHVVTDPLTTFAVAVSSVVPRRFQSAKFRKLQDRASFAQRVINEYKVPGTHPELAAVIQAMKEGGFRATEKSDLWSGERTEELKRAVRKALDGQEFTRAVENMFKGKVTRSQVAGFLAMVPDAAFAAIEVIAAPIFAKYVPLMKTAATFRAVEQRLRELDRQVRDEPLTVEERRREMWDVVKEMDLRFGQVVYDNYFVDRFAKDLAQLLVFAPGWTFGTMWLMGRGARDLVYAPIPEKLIARGGRATRRLLLGGGGRGGGGTGWTGGAPPGTPPGGRGNGPELPPRNLPQPFLGRSGKYWMMALLGTSIIAGFWTYWNTGDVPGTGDDEGRGDYWKDFFAFRDGTYDIDGNPNRYTIPGYLMHDVYGWYNHPTQIALAKLTPVLSATAEFIQNRTFNGDLVFDPEADVATKGRQIALHTMERLGTPLSYQNYREAEKRGDAAGADVLRNTFGVNPAKREFVRTKAQNDLIELMARRGHTALTPDAAEARQARTELLRAKRMGQDDVGLVEKAIEFGVTAKEMRTIFKRAGTMPYLERFKALSLDDAWKIFNEGTPTEQKLFRAMLRKKQTAAQQRQK